MSELAAAPGRPQVLQDLIDVIGCLRFELDELETLLADPDKPYAEIHIVATRLRDQLRGTLQNYVFNISNFVDDD